MKTGAAKDLIDGVNPTTGEPIKLGVLTSGGDAQGMNAAVRAVVRTALAAGAEPYALLEGWEGAVRGGKYIKKMDWSSVSSILNRGGTAIGTARSQEFREYEGRQKSVAHLIERGIDRLIVIGGDGSLTGANEFRKEWSAHLEDLVASGEITAEQAAAHPSLTLIGLVASIDNDLVGSDMTIGTDSALARIVDAMDMISSTAAAHQRTFIVEVMGRRCGYLPLMAAVAGGADYVFAPEMPAQDGWQREMAEKLEAGREAGRRESMIVVAEGARDCAGQRITADDVKRALEQELNVDARVTILGHIQRGGAPSAYDRWMSTLLGYCAVQEVLEPAAVGTASILGVRRNRVARLPLEKTVEDTRAVEKLVEQGDYEAARRARGTSFYQMGNIFEILSAPPTDQEVAKNAKRVAVLHAGGLAPGMNTAARAVVRLGLNKGWEILGVQGSWAGLTDENIRTLRWDDVEGWAFDGGAVLGTRRPVPSKRDFYHLARAIERNDIDALIVIGGFAAYEAVRDMWEERFNYPALEIPMVLLPTTIDNNLPGSELSIGADTAINNAVWALDRMKESAAASRRCFVAEAMGRKCGYLALMSGMASGAEYVYLNEEPLTLDGLSEDIDLLRKSFKVGRNVFLVVMNEETSTHYDRRFLAQAMEAAGEGLFDVRNSALGYIQQGGDPTAFDRLLATRLANAAVKQLRKQFKKEQHKAVYLGVAPDGITVQRIERMNQEIDFEARRPKDQWWLPLREVTELVSFRYSNVPVKKVLLADVPEPMRGL